ncbi:MAG: acyl-CoA dehydrogenase [Gammaproteobacteria bacterium]|nr:acyl-CoA dehydrogenase [Gammaproteobacteria bacterium]MDH3766955.1 acyl-CoA dehydrogenase [Gammaproteobacteria bacterium]
MSFLFWTLLFVGGGLTLAYRRINLRTSTIIAGGAVFAYLAFGNGGFAWNLLVLVSLATMVALNLVDFRRNRITRPVLKMFRKVLPRMSETERAALEAGDVWWDGDLFGGEPKWRKLLGYPKPTLSKEEQAFLDGPVEELCGMINEWEVTHERADLSEETWQFLKDNGFFAMIIPKRYGGLEFSALAHSEVLAKISGHSATCGSTVAVPNSLGPAELLLHYGTEEQKNYYLPRLARGEEIPCFGLTSPRAGSDATSLTDSGVVTRGMFNGEEVIGIRLNWKKRYITLAPVATVLGLAFKLRDPEHLLGDEEKEDYGITCALIPTHLPGVTTGRRHLPLNLPFQNGPTEGKDVFVPVDYIIGGAEMAGEGWRMLVESLTVGRCISLPSNTSGGARAGLAATGAYARIRSQFNMPIGRFDGIQKVLARIAGRTYITEAGRVMTAGAVDQGVAPGVPSAILKYHSTEMARLTGIDVVDIHGGKAICLGPKNYAGRGYQAAPIAVTVEGANILTRNMIIYGQGAIRCHPYVLKEMQAAADPNHERGLEQFDDLLFRHIGFSLSNAARSVAMGLSLSKFTSVPVDGPTKRFYQHINRFSAGFALLSDAAMLTLGGTLKRKEMLSARLGDVLSFMYLASAVLKRFEDQGRPAADLPVVEWACRHLLYQAQEQLHGVLRNLPNRWVAAALRVIIFPLGRRYHAPRDRLESRVAELFIRPSATRERLIGNTYRAHIETNPLAQLEDAMARAIEIEPIEKRLRRSIKDGVVKESTFDQQIDDAVNADVLTRAEADKLIALDKIVMEIIAVDDFETSEIGTKAKSSPPKSQQRIKVASIREEHTDRRPTGTDASASPPV